MQPPDWSEGDELDIGSHLIGPHLRCKVELAARGRGAVELERRGVVGAGGALPGARVQYHHGI